MKYGGLPPVGNGLDAAMCASARARRHRVAVHHHNPGIAQAVDILDGALQAPIAGTRRSSPVAPVRLGAHSARGAEKGKHTAGAAWQGVQFLPNRDMLAAAAAWTTASFGPLIDLHGQTRLVGQRDRPTPASGNSVCRVEETSCLTTPSSVPVVVVVAAVDGRTEQKR